ncbi:class I adenylate-forming enzyme family protein [Nocardia arthritidis]|uniref:class I adenylate-forming enzyme family protein n=1 Tax=Nocardia arthritidis TaxID=228602 RepID=UPI0007A41457|nr:AMP-binding protein [Nocardia arthritidis]
MERIHDVLHRAATTAADAVGWIADDRKIRFAEMDAWSDRVATGLLRLGIRRGDRIAVNGPNTPEWLAVYFGAAKIGAVVVGLSVRYRENEFARILGDSCTRAVVTVPSSEGIDFLGILAGLRDRLPHLETVVTFGAGGDHTLDELSSTPADTVLLTEAEDAVRENDPVMIIYTSGTTGRPKGAVLTHAGQLAAATAQAGHMRLGPGDTLPVAVPLNHVSGITCCVLAALVACARSVLLPTFDAAAAAELFHTADLTIWVGVPTMHTLLLNHSRFTTVDTAAVRLVVTGGANAEPALLERLINSFPNATVMNLYGLSESSGAVVMTPWDGDTETTARAIGRPLPTVRIKIADAAGTEVSVGETGELLLRTPSVMAGYHNMPAETADAIGSDGWLRTGDIARTDNDGFITLHGRAKDMFVQGGYNIYPIEVENILAEHPQVLMAAGIGVPDPVLGEIGRYYVVLTPDSQLTEGDLKQFCADKIADYKVPREIIIRPDLPLSPSGKVHKAALRNQSAQSGAAG